MRVACERAGITGDWLEAARRSPVRALISTYRVALAVRASLASSRLAVDAGPHQAIRDFNAQQSKLMATDDAAEGVRSFMERREPNFTGR